MSLRARLTLFFIVIVVMPVTAVTAYGWSAVARTTLLRAADEALYETKLQGRDRVVTAGPRLLPLAARPGQVKGRAARVE